MNEIHFKSIVFTIYQQKKGKKIPIELAEFNISFGNIKASKIVNAMIFEKISCFFILKYH